jgi:predicted phosphodiesterase
MSVTMCAIGDTHGHLQLALCVAARWQRTLEVEFDAVLLCGDVGSFTSESQLDNATRRHGKTNPCELEFLHQWAVRPQPPWLQMIFQPLSAHGLGLRCPVVMVHGNHEGFAHLASLSPSSIPAEPVSAADLPAVDTGEHIRWLPSGWRFVTPSGLVIAAIGGIEPSQRYAGYHDMAYIDETAILHLLDQPKVDLLMTHQGPSSIQGQHGSSLLQTLLDEKVARIWCHGHSTPHMELTSPGSETLVVPLGDVAFETKGISAGDPGMDAWASIRFDGEVSVRRERPDFWRDYRQRRWLRTVDGLLVSPDLIPSSRRAY